MTEHGPDRPRPATPVRLDVALVAAGLARSRGQAQDLVRRGVVSVDGSSARKPSQLVAPGAALEVTSDDATWVGRAAHKLLGAFAAFEEQGLSAAGHRCLDVGACTGGFTQVLLTKGAAHVTALDVGHDQLAPELRDDPRVTDLSGTTVRGLVADAIGGPVDLLVADLSFISLRLVLPDLAGLLVPGGHAVLLVKPQFEVGRSRVSKTGLVGAARDRRDAVVGVLESAREGDWSVRGMARSPISGSEGNREYLLWLGRGAAVGMTWQAQMETADRIVQETAP